MASELGCKSNLGYSISDIFFVVVLDQVASLSTLYRLVQLASSSLSILESLTILSSAGDFVCVMMSYLSIHSKSLAFQSAVFFSAPGSKVPLLAPAHNTLSIDGIKMIRYFSICPSSLFRQPPHFDVRRLQFFPTASPVHQFCVLLRSRLYLFS